MLRAPSRHYLYCQSIGWGIFLLAGIYTRSRFELIFITFLIGLFITHILRNAILRYGWLNAPLRRGLPRLLLATILAAAIGGVVKMTAFNLGGITSKLMERLPWLLLLFYTGLEYILLFLPWTIIYCLYHHIQKTREKNTELRRLELLLKEKAATANDTTVDIESITRSLDRIRSLIGEDTTRARAEITAFSQLLRKGYLKATDPQ